MRLASSGVLAWLTGSWSQSEPGGERD